MGKIIAFCGRMRSGKTELAKMCEQSGYKKLYFALPLKQLCAKILNMSINELNKAKDTDKIIDFTIDENICSILSEETNISLETTKELCNGKHLDNVRDILQFIGTDYIRKCNKDWHVNKIRQMIDLDKNYVIDDVRFPNEKKMIENLGGDCWFVVRPTLDNISNHESETSILWGECYNKIIINDSTLNAFLFKWGIFVNNYEDSCAVRDREFNRLLESGNADEIRDISEMNSLLLHKALFTYVPKEFTKDKVVGATMNEDKSVFVKYSDGTIEVIENELEIEDLKKVL